MNKNIYFTLQEVQQCEEFAKEIAWKHPHFRDKKNKAKRTQKQVEESVLLGKLAELAVYRVFHRYFKDQQVSDIDFNIYPVGETDEQDISVNNVHISIKSSKPNSSCLLIEKEKFTLNEQGCVVAVDKKTPPDAYVFVHVDLKKKQATICGGISFEEFWKKKRFMPRKMVMNRENLKKFFYEQVPPNQLSSVKGVPLLAENYGMHINHLHNPLETIQALLRSKANTTIS